MKRTRDDVFPGSQFKRPFGSSRGEPYVQSAPGGGHGVGGGRGAGGVVVGFTSQKLTTNDALGYLKEVKEIFQDQREKYETFLEVMKDFKAQRTDTAGVIVRVKELFKGHKNLIYGFNAFLPKGYEITLDEDDVPPKKTVEFEEAISLVNKIKKRFQDEEHIYKSFLDTLNMYRKQQKDINEVHSQVSALFTDHPDLLEEFGRFLPDVSATTQQVPSNRNQVQRYYERSSGAPMLRQVPADESQQHQLDRTIVVSGDRDFSIECAVYEDDKPVLKMQKDLRRRVEKENRNRRNHGQDDREIEQDNSRDFTPQRFPENGKLERKSGGFGAFSDHVPYDEKGIYNQACAFCEKVKERLCSQDDYQAFLKCLDIFSTGIIKRNDLQNLVTDLLGKYPDLMDEFNQFLEQCENIDGFLSNVMSKKSLFVGGHITRPTKMEDGEREHEHEIEVAKEKERCREKYWAKSIQELDLSDCERCTPSYRLLPEDYPIPSASQRSELGAQVLNDHWVSVTSGSEDYSFKHMRRNQYEESLFRCEDDRFELDILLENVNSTAKRGEVLLNSIIENNIGMDRPIQIEDYFTAINLRSIERLYGDHGLDVIDVLRRNPALALPVILTRLKQKQEEWSKCREDFNKVWAEVYAKNHYKSLDHRSFYFKQQDPKNLSVKSLVAEIRELKKKMQREDDVLQVTDAGHQQPMIPHLEYEYADASIHDDLHKLLHFSCEEICSRDQLNKIVRLWSKFLETILGVSPCSGDAESGEDVGKTKQTEKHDEESSLAESNVRPTADNSILMSRQSKQAEIGDENSLPQLPKLGGSSLIDEDSEAKESLGDVDGVCEDEPIGSADKLEKKELTSIVGTEKRSEGGAQMDTDEREASSIQSLANRAENCHGRMGTEEIAGSEGNQSRHDDALIKDHRPEHNPDAAPSPQDGEVKTPGSLLDGALSNGTSIDTYHGESVELPETEKEEGELSPEGDMEEDNFVIPKPQLCQSGSGEDQHCQEAEGDKDADNNGSGIACKASHVSGFCRGECLIEETGAGKEGEQKKFGAVEQNKFDNKPESEEKVDGLASTSPPRAFLERISLPLKPLAKHVPTVDEKKKDSRVFFGNDDFYMLFRLHQTLYERILSAKRNSTVAGLKSRNSRDTGPLDPYARFMNALYSLLDGSADNTRFEDECRAIIGNHSYVLFTLDKLIFKLVKQLQTIATEDMDNKLLELYEYENSRKRGTAIDSVYYENVRVLLHEENIYRFECSSSPPQLTIQLMDNATEKLEAHAISREPGFANNNLHNDFFSVSPSRKEPDDTILHSSRTS